MYSKTELTEIKYLIFSRYMNQKVLWNGVDLVELEKCWNWKHESFRLQLKPLSSITDEDAKIVADLVDISPLYQRLDRVHEGKRFLDRMTTLRHDVCQYLQLKGYALPQLVIINGKPVTLSVEQQIESLIIETKN